MPDDDGRRSYRVEHDSMGEVRVPADAHWGAQTQRAIENFPISGLPIAPSLVRALAMIKADAARVNSGLRDVPQVSKSVGNAIAAAADMVAGGTFDEHFPIDVFQTGSGTSSNMNANEVIAHLASEALGEPVHPNDQVNASQSSNDVFPSAVHLAVALGDRTTICCRRCELLHKALRRKQRAFAKVVKSGRTHLMDATPVTLGQEFGGYATQIEDGITRLRRHAAAGVQPAARRHRRRHRNQRAEAVCGPRDPTAGRTNRAAAHRSARSLRGTRCARCARRVQRSAPHPRRFAVQDRKRHPAHGQWAAHGSGRDPAPGSAAGLVDHAGQGESGDRRSRHPGRACRCSATTLLSRSRVRRATSSSTCSCR